LFYFFGGATDHYFGSIDREHVEGYEALSEVVLCSGGSDHSCGGAHYGSGLPLKELSLVGLEAQFIVFLWASGIEWLYSGVAIISASALLIFVLNSLTFWVVALLGLG
jgi:hypothetical protein